MCPRAVMARGRSVRNRFPPTSVATSMMVETPRSATPSAPPPSGLDDLETRERWLKRRRAHGFAERRSGLIAIWVAVAALLSWLFVAAFAGFGH